MEIGVGSGARARLWLDKFIALDRDCGTGYYSKLKFLLGDYSPTTLDKALAAVGPQAPMCSVIPIDAHNPFKTLSFLRFKILFVHLTNVYDNLMFDEIARRDGQLYLIEVRPYLHTADAEAIASAFHLEASELPAKIAQLLEVGPEALGPSRPWRRLLESRLQRAAAWKNVCACSTRATEEHLPQGVGRQPARRSPRRGAARRSLSPVAWEPRRASSTPCHCSIRAAICRCRTSSSRR
jgi:hypothetical protein